VYSRPWPILDSVPVHAFRVAAWQLGPKAPAGSAKVPRRDRDPESRASAGPKVPRQRGAPCRLTFARSRPLPRPFPGSCLPYAAACTAARSEKIFRPNGQGFTPGLAGLTPRPGHGHPMALSTTSLCPGGVSSRLPTTGRPGGGHRRSSGRRRPRGPLPRLRRGHTGRSPPRRRHYELVHNNGLRS